MAATWSSIIGLILLLLPLAPSSSSYIMYRLGGNVFPIGRFFVEMKIGEPLMLYQLDIDTGSNVTWLECYHPVHGCHCSPGVNQLYRPALGNLRVECKDPFCDALHADLPDLPDTNPQCTREDPHQCHYKVEYVNGTSEGVLSNDTVSLAKGNRPMVFGCGYNQRPRNPSQEPNQKPVHGILGLGNGIVGFAAQLKKQQVITKNVIGHCLGYGRNRGGYLFIGDYKFPPNGITWAPMRKYEPFYSPGQATVHLDGQQIYANGMSAVFDSGATYTYMPSQIYNPLLAKVIDLLGDAGKPAKDDPTLPRCWKKPESIESLDDVKNTFKTLELRFGNNIVMKIPPIKYLILSDYNNLCLGILNGSDVDENQKIIIGDISMQDMLVVYDNERGMMGWANIPCTTSRL
uniref:Uncharacterized protein n=1 Tax=Avena sativa TaxID=4498 RepID=A0ACD5W6N3_AVESA